MSNPADNTSACATCGMAPQVRGCTPGKCSSTFAGTVLCASCIALKEKAKREGKVGFALCGECSARMANDREASSLDHPLPWRWEGGLFDHGYLLVDARGQPLLGTRCNDHHRSDDHFEPLDPYVRAVTERAGAMEAGLRNAAARMRVLDRAVHEESGGGGPWEPCEEIVETEALLAEIAAAKAGGR